MALLVYLKDKKDSLIIKEKVQSFVAKMNDDNFKKTLSCNLWDDKKGIITKPLENIVYIVEVDDKEMKEKMEKQKKMREEQQGKALTVPKMTLPSNKKH